jgi:ABC-type transport system substrate-binding protein/class 3 adenylate cyclase
MADADRPLSGRNEGIENVHIRTFLIADVRGYTLFTQERGDEAATKLAMRFAQVAREVVEEHGGSVIELRGDEALAVFNSARQAILAATHAQDRFLEETVADPSFPLPVGIGLDAGEAVPMEAGYRGGALNLAARLCGRAGPGEIMASQGVVHLARKVDGVRYVDRGDLHLKGMTEPVRVFRAISEEGDPAERFRKLAPGQPRGGPAPLRLARRHPAMAIVVALALIAAVAVPTTIVLRGDSGEDAVEVGSNSVARMNAEDGSLEGAAELGQRPGASAIGFGSLWVAQPDNGRVARLDLENGSIVDTIDVGASPAGIAVGEGSVWVTNAGDGTVSRIDPDSNMESDVLDAGSRPLGIAVGDGALWVGDALGAELLRVDPLSGEAEAVPLAGQPSGVVFTPEGVWVSYTPAGIALVGLDDLSFTLTQDVGNGPTSVLAAFDSIWVANHLDNTVSRLDASAGTEQAKVQVGEGPSALVAAGGSVWVANEFDSSITSIDPSTNSGVPVPVGGATASLAADGGDDLWLAVGVSATEHRGGTLTVSSRVKMRESFYDPRTSLDPAVVVYNDPIWGQIISITNDGLLSFKKVGGADAATLVPDLASALPEVSADGLTYRFPLREGIRYSNGDPVRPEDFRHAVERTIALNPGDDDVAALYGAIEGAKACRKEPSTCDLSQAIVADAATVTFHLAHPDPDLQFKLAMPWAFPVPDSTPVEDQGLDPLPATGPYMIAEAGRDGLLLVRNPEFHEWSGAAQPDGFVNAIAWRFDEEPAGAFDRLNAGELDWMTDPLPPDDLRSLQTAHPEQVVPWLNASTLFVGFDVQSPPFDEERVRQALNYAIDRDYVVELWGGPTIFQPTCQILPPNLQGYEPFCPYNTREPESGVWSAPDLDQARALIEDADAIGGKITVLVPDETPSPGAVKTMAYIVEVLNGLDLPAKLKIVPAARFFDAVSAGEGQAWLSGWVSIYPSAHDFIDPQFSCGGFGNLSGYCSKTLDAAIGDAQQLQATDLAAANGAWIEIEHQLVEEAIWVPLANPVSTYAFSARTENIQVHPAWGILLSRLWVR